MYLTQEYLKKLFEYQAGLLYWRIKPSPRINIGAQAGCVDKNGYRIIRINKQNYKAHRIIFFMFNGYWPEMVDHINGNKDDNRIENLRAADQHTNQYNRGIPKNNSSGVRGVYWNKSANKWQAYCWVDGVNHHIGVYTDLNEAKLARENFTKIHHKNYARQEW